MNNYFQDKMGPARMPINQNDLQQPQPSQIGMGPGTDQVGYGEGDPTDPKKKERLYDPKQYTWQRLGYSTPLEFAEEHLRKKEELAKAMEGFTFDKDTQYYKKGDKEDSYMSKSDAEMLLKFLQEEGGLYVDADAHGAADSYEHGIAFYKPSGMFKTNDGDWRISFDWYILEKETGDIVKWKTGVEDYDDGSAHAIWDLTPLTERENIFASRRPEREQLRERRRSQSMENPYGG